MNPESESLRASKLHNLKAGYGDGIIIALDCTGVLLGTLFEAAGKQHCFVGRQVLTGDITDFFSETRIANPSSRAYQAGRIIGVISGATIVYGLPFLLPATATGNGLRFLYRYDERIVEGSERRHLHE